MVKKLLSIFSCCILIFLSSQYSYAQTIVDIIEIGTSGTPAMGTSNYVANEAIYTETEIGASNFTTAATAINVIGFSVGTVGSNPVFNSVNIYMKEVPLTTTTFTAGTYTTTGYTLVYSGPVKLFDTGWTNIALTTPFMRTTGNNLQVLIERTDNATHLNYIYKCSRGNQTSLTANTTRRYNSTAALSGTTNLAVSNFRQAIRLANLANDANITNLYTLGKLPLVYGDNHVVQARVINTGPNTLNNLNVTLNITGSNTFTDVQVVPTLAPNAEVTVSFLPFTPTTQGSNTVTVTLPADDVAANNTKTWTQQVTQNLASYKNPAVVNTGGVGFTGGTGDFVAKFNSATTGQINEIKVDFTTNGQPYTIGIWDATGTAGAPGASLWTSSALTTAIGTAFIPVPNISVTGDYFVGVKQSGTTNVGFGYQTEAPIRPATFYYTSPTNSTSWLDFAPGSPFRFSIEPQYYIPQPPNCATAHAPADKSTTVDINTTTALTWASGGGGATDYDVYFGTTYPPPFMVNQTGTSFPVTLAPGTTYYWYVLAKNAFGTATGCDTLEFTTPANDNASGATPLVVGAGCTGNVYANNYGTQAAGEPYPSCNNTTTGHHTVWFKFKAPASGAVRVSTDILPVGTLIDSKIGLFAATDSTDYTTFSIISCDEDGGTNSANMSILYATGLTPGVTYYIQVDGFATTSIGTFCLAVDELNNSMIASTAANCAAFQTPFSTATTSYTGWIPIMTNTGQLVAMVRNQAGTVPVNFTGSLNIVTGTPRQDATSGQYYLNRNYLINNSSITTPVDLRLFFLTSELTALNAVDPNATISNVNVTHQSGTACQANHNSANGTNAALVQAANGSANGVSWIDVQPGSFSNFYIMSGIDPLQIKLEAFTATNSGRSNRIAWTTASEERTDGFELERSTDGIAFKAIYATEARGIAGNYTYVDNTPFDGVNYYRLKLKEGNGRSAYSGIVTAVVGGKGFTVQAFPNPVSKELTVQVSGIKGADATVQITDLTGKVIRSIAMDGSIGTIDLSRLANGIYLVKYSDASRTQTIRINKE